MLDIVNFALLGERYFCIPELCFRVQLSYLETVFLAFVFHSCS